LATDFSLSLRHAKTWLSLSFRIHIELLTLLNKYSKDRKKRYHAQIDNTNEFKMTKKHKI